MKRGSQEARRKERGRESQEERGKEAKKREGENERERMFQTQINLKELQLKVQQIK
jgi:hypothetical protein